MHSKSPWMPSSENVDTINTCVEQVQYHPSMIKQFTQERTLSISSLMKHNSTLMNLIITCPLATKKRKIGLLMATLERKMGLQMASLERKIGLF